MRTRIFILSVALFVLLCLVVSSIKASDSIVLKGHCEGSTYVFSVKNIGPETAYNAHWRMLVNDKVVTGGYLTLAPEQRIVYPVRFNAPVRVRVELSTESVELTCVGT